VFLYISTMPAKAGLRKAPKQPRQRKCKACFDLDFPRDDGDTKLFSSPYGFTNRVMSMKDAVTSVGGGCQVCFAILKAIDSLIMPHINGPPQPPAERFSVVPPPKSSKFPFLAYVPGPYIRLSYISLRVKRGELPLQVHVNIPSLLYGIPDDKLGFGKAKLKKTFEGEATELSFNFELFIDHLDPAPFPGIPPARRVPARLSSDRRRRLVKGWIDDCVRNHPHCCKPLPGQENDDQTGPWRPKRLLDLGDNPRNAIRLVDGTGTAGPYATVSHVWNRRRGVSELELDSHSLPRLMEERIRWRDLPPVYQDAVVIASEQNIRYLWIHALCVVQNDVEDLNWHVEQAHRTYGHSYLNIALERSTHLHETCLGTRWLDRSQGVEVQDIEIPVFKDGKPYKLYARPAVHYRESHSKWTVFPYHYWFAPQDFPKRPLLESMDFVQEQIISPRTLHVDTTEMAWECRVQTGCECDPSTTDTYEAFSLVARAKLTLVGHSSHPWYRKTSQLWDAIRSTYIRRTVQKRPFTEEERLGSLVGLASCMQPLIGERFVAGVFCDGDDAFARELMWYIGPAAMTSGQELNQPSRRRVDCECYTPSWSWASIVTENGHTVRSADDMFESGCEGLGFMSDRYFHARHIVTAKPEGIAPKLPDEPCFHAHSWELGVSGQLIECKVNTQPHARLVPSTGMYKFIAADAEYFPRVPADLPLLDEIPEPPTFITDWDAMAGDVMMDCDYFDAERRATATDGFTRAYLLLLGRVDWSRYDFGGAPVEVNVGLVLHRVGDGKSDKFQRIGVFWFHEYFMKLFDGAQVQDIVLV
jgi:hypothetical protein